MPPKKKYESGCEKRKKKKRIDELIQSQRGTINKFVIREPQLNAENDNLDTANHFVDGIDAENGNLDTAAHFVDDVNAENVGSDDHIAYNVINNESGNGDMGDSIVDSENIACANLDIDVEMPSNAFHMVNIFDPRNWDALNSEMINTLAIKGPKRDLCIVKGIKDKFGRQFSATFYTRVLPNNEKCDRDWLVYSKELDKVFCFCCKLFKKGCGRGQLANEGFSDWAHLCVRIKEHETSMEHVQNMITWYELR